MKVAVGHTHSSLGLYLQPQSLEDVTAPCLQLQVVSVVMKIEIIYNKVLLFLNCLCRHHNRESSCLKSFENTPSIIMQIFLQLGILHGS